MGAYATKRDLVEAILAVAHNPDSQNSMNILPLTPEAIPRASNEGMLMLATYLKLKKVAYATDREQQILFVDIGSVRNLLKKKAALMNSSDFDVDGLRTLLEIYGYCVAEIRADAEKGTVEFVSKRQKSLWQRLRIRFGF